MAKIGAEKLIIHIEVNSRMPVDADDLKDYLRYRLNFKDVLTIERINIEPVVIPAEG